MANYEDKIKKAQQQIRFLEDRIKSLTGMARQIAEVENDREIDALNKQIELWQSRLDETAEQKAEREEAEREEAQRLEEFNNNFERLENNDWDY
jgi:predicted  nucleic acid-binding Zn-ribbon protein